MVIAGVQPRLLRDVIEETLRDRTGAEVVKSIPTRHGLIQAVRDEGANVALLSFEEHEEPKAVRDLHAALPDVLIVGLSGDGDRLSLFRRNLGVDQLVKAMGVICDSSR